MRTYSFLKIVMFLGSLGLAGSTALAQVQQVDPIIPHLEEPGNATLIAWAIAGIVTVGILAIAFKNAKRTHME